MTDKKIILIADDIEIMRDLNTEFVERLFSNYIVETCSSGTELRNRLEKGVEGVACVITDDDMKEGPTGGELITKYASKVPMVLCYGRDQNAIGEKAVQDGAVGYLKKPYNMKEFKEIVSKALVVI